MKIRNFYIIIALTTLLLLNGIIVKSFSDSTLQKISQDIIEIVRKVNPAVVEVTAISEIDILDEDGKPFKEFLELFEELSNQDFPKRYHQRNIGSGIIIDKKGHIVTTASVIHNAHDIRILLTDGRKLKAKLVGTDEETDVAVLLIKADNLPLVPFGNSDDITSGALVVAVGRSYGHTPTYSFGITNGVEFLPNGPTCDMIKLNVHVSPGNSGGAVVNTSGELIGIISAMLAEPQVSQFSTQFTKPRLQRSKIKQTSEILEVSESSVPTLPQTSVNDDIFRKQITSFAVPINTANKIAKELIAHGEIRRGWLGVRIKQQISETQPTTPVAEVAKLLGKGERIPIGVQIIQFAENSPAAQAGLKLNDTVVAFNDKAVRTTYDLKRFVADSRPDTNVKLKILREGKELFFNVKLGERN